MGQVFCLSEQMDRSNVLGQDLDIQMTEKLEKQVVEMCNLNKSVMEKGLVASIESLMHKLKMTAGQAMDALSIPENEQPKYKELIKQ